MRRAAIRLASFLIASFLVLSLGAGIARADVAPPDACTSPGQPCQTAGVQYNQPGTCTATTCTRSVRNADGGFTPISYACDLCQASGAGGATGSTGAAGNGGTAGTSGNGGTAGTTGTGKAGSSGAAGSSPSTSSGSSSCAVAAGPADDRGWGGLGLLVGLGLGAARRRRHVSR
jgi:MYXO-CTERM domain-containing protein